MIVAETVLGRMIRKSPVGAYHSFGKSGRLSFGGWINAIIPVLILVTFGSYMKKDVPIEASTKNVEIFDTAIAIMAGLMIIPAVFAFSGGNPVFPLSTLCSSDQFHCPDRKCCIHISG